MTDRVIIDLFGGSGSWSQPYADAGYDVRVIDLTRGRDVLTYRPPLKVHGILAAPPCTEFAVSGARWWADKARDEPEKLIEAIALATSAMHIIRQTAPVWWALENPVGRLRDYIGPMRYSFQPWEYGDPEVKRTCIWGEHVQPKKSPVDGPYEARVHRMAPSPDRAALRSLTPPGFARAFFEANP